ncbi:MAG: family helicase, partial [Rhizobium sp.]|nr:family helicase [Rhizobium sp.]
HDREQHRVRGAVRNLKGDIERLTNSLPVAEADAERSRAAPPKFEGTIGGVTYEKHKEFGDALISKMRTMLQNTQDETVDVGKYGDFGLSIETMTSRGQVDTVVHIDGAESYQIEIDNPNKVDATGLARRIQNTISRLADVPEDIRADIATKTTQIPQLEKQIGEWAGAAELEHTGERHRELLDQLKPKKKETPAPAKDTLAEVPFGWDGADMGMVDPGFTADDFAKVERIIVEVSGLDATQWAERIEVRHGDKLWGETEAFYPAGVYNTVRDAILMSREHAYPSVAYHESFHRIQNLFLTPKERAVLKAERGRLKRIVASKMGREGQVNQMAQVELEAEAFAIYANNRDNMTVKPHATIRALWDRILELLRQIRNFMAGRGFDTIDTIFDRAKSGEMKARARNRDPALSIGKVYSSPVKVTERHIVEGVRGKLTDMSPALLKAVPLNYFTELKRPNMTAVDGYLKMKRALDTYRGNKHAESDAIAQEWLKYTRLGFAGKDRSKAQLLADLMHESTLAGIDPSITSESERSKPGWDMLRKKYVTMPPAGRALYAKVRDAYVAQADELDSILLDNVRKTMEIALDRAETRYNKDVERIKQSGLTAAKQKIALDEAAAKYKGETKRSIWSMKARLTQLRIAFESSRVPAPYFPLARFGRYFVAVTDVNGETLSFSKHETAADRDRTARDMRKEFPTATVKAGVLDNAAETRDAMDPRIIAEIETILGNANVGEDVMDQIWQRYLESMPDLSTRKRFIHRKGVSGFNTDALRVFASHMFHAAHQMARLKYGMELQEMVHKAKDQAQEADDQTRGMTLANELGKRHDWVMNPTGGRVAQIMTSAAFVWMLAASPASAMVNLSQTVMMGVPILGARHGGVVKASAAILKASNDFVRGGGDIMKAVSPEERQVMQMFYDSGLIDRTHSHDMAGVGDTGVDYSPMKSKIMSIISWAFHKAEVANREITAMAAYRLARASGANMTDAVDQA